MQLRLYRATEIKWSKDNELWWLEGATVYNCTIVAIFKPINMVHGVGV